MYVRYFEAGVWEASRNNHAATGVKEQSNLAINSAEEKIQVGENSATRASAVLVKAVRHLRKFFKLGTTERSVD